METINSSVPGDGSDAVRPPQFAVLDFLFPGFSVLSTFVHTYMGLDLNLYIPLVMVISGLVFAWNYISDYCWTSIEKHLMSFVRIRTDDEIYNIIMAWVAAQRFAQSSRRFIVNTNINSRSWFLWRYNEDEEEDENNAGKKPLQYTPSFGTHFFWYKGHLLRFERHENREQSGFLVSSEREEISIACFGRNPRVLKELLLDARQQYIKKDECKTLIYRGASDSNGGGPSWQRCMTRSSRPMSTVILNEKVKKDLLEDVTDYLDPATRRWYSNRGIPYRRGYLLYGPPGTGKSSLSLALAGFFRMKIYMVSLSSPVATEENLASLFIELPKKCVVLLEDIDTAGLTHTREDTKDDVKEDASADVPATPAPRSTSKRTTVAPTVPGRLSLSGLLNILDGVASQEGRVLIMTTNHLEKLDKALIRPGRVDMVVNFGLADADMAAAIFRAIYVPYEGESSYGSGSKVDSIDIEEKQKDTSQADKERAQVAEHVKLLGDKFGAELPEYEFSPAEIQGLLLKHKRDPDGVFKVLADWVVDTRKEKKKQEIEDAVTKRKEEEKARKAEAKKIRKEERARARKKKEKAKRKENGESSGSELSSDSDSDPESEVETKSEIVGKKDETKDKAKEEVKDEAKDEAKEETKAVASEKNMKDQTSAIKEEAKVSKGTSDSGYDTPEIV